MVFTFLPVVSFDANAVGVPTPGDYWTSNPAYYEVSWYDPGVSTFYLSNEQQFAGFAALVNGNVSAYPNGVTFSGKTVSLTANLDLSNHFWYPIGGVSPLSSGVPTGKYFAGAFDGGNYTINGLYIEYITTSPANNSGYGLFGYINGGGAAGAGLIQNFTIGYGGLNLGASIVSAVGAAVGYTNGSIHNVHNAIDVIMSSDDDGASMLGGIAGTVENISGGATLVTVDLCSNTGNIEGRGRVGGVVGAVYAGYTGGIIVDQCYNRGASLQAGYTVPMNTIISHGDQRKSYTGGVVGYCRGYITNCYSYSSIIISDDAHYQGGVVGILQGFQAPIASLSNSYSITIFDRSADPDYDGWLFASVDDSDDVLVENSLWADTYYWKGFPVSAVNVGQTPGTGSNGWGDWTSVGYFYDRGEFDSKTVASLYTTPGPSYIPDEVVIDTLNHSSAHTLGGAYSQSAGTNYGYPYLTSNP
jgi:hypothetical protein